MNIAKTSWELCIYSVLYNTTIRRFLAQYLSCIPPPNVTSKHLSIGLSMSHKGQISGFVEAIVGNLQVKFELIPVDSEL